MPRWGMVVDLDKCTACQACVAACRAENNIPIAGPQQAALGRAISWMELIPILEGEYPHMRARLLPRPCMHCENPPCVKVCPVQALTKSPEGIVIRVHARCIGCRFCVQACPYGVNFFNWYEPAWPEELAESLSPDTAIRPKGVVEKCYFCHHRLQTAREQARVEGRELRGEGDYVPACVQVCPAGALTFGDLENPSTRVWQLSRSPRSFRLLEELGLEPHVYYLREGEWYAGAPSAPRRG